MIDPAYTATALVLAVSIAVALRAIPFGLKNAMRGSAALDELGRWMPLGAVTILAVYCLTSIDIGESNHGIPELSGVIVTAGMHLWRHNLILSLITGTAVCVTLANSVLA